MTVGRCCGKTVVRNRSEICCLLAPCSTLHAPCLPTRLRTLRRAARRFRRWRNQASRLPLFVSLSVVRGPYRPVWRHSGAVNAWFQRRRRRARGSAALAPGKMARRIKGRRRIMITPTTKRLISLESTGSEMVGKGAGRSVTLFYRRFRREERISASVASACWRRSRPGEP
jgi:hypothetical protein